MLVIGLAACAAPAAQPAALKVLAVETFLAEIAQNVAGDRVQVAALMPIGVDPHAFEPTPQDVVKISQSQVLIVNGAGFEEWLDKVLQNAGGTRTLVEAAAGLTMREPGSGEAAHEHEPAHAHEAAHAHDDHSVASHTEMVCKQLAGKTAEETLQAGVDAGRAGELHDEHAHEAGHAHGRELLTLRLNPQAGKFAGYVRLDVEAEEGYAITAAQGTISVTTTAGAPVAVAQELPLDCAGMTQGRIFKLVPGEYTIALTGFTAETTPFSAAPVHEDEHQHGTAAATPTADAHAGHHHHEGDPHFWLDPIHVIKYTENIRDGLSLADPAGRAVYAANAAAYIAKLQELDGWIKTQVQTVPAARRLLVTNHESFGYFADRYGFSVVGTVIPSVSTGAAPSAQEMAALIKHIKEHAAPAIFLETGANPQLAKQIGQEAGIKVVTELFTHSITDAKGAAPTYIDMMKYNVKAIVDALLK
jgi:ABC-type Zn uptake system ZnuABC Zn-binding protein ZnuA